MTWPVYGCYSEDSWGDVTPSDAFTPDTIAQDERDAERYAAGWAAGRQFDVRSLMHPHVEPDEIDEDPSE